MKKHVVMVYLAGAALAGFGLIAAAEETSSEKLETTVNKVEDSAKRTYRRGKEEVCEIINGKMECAVKKMKNKGRDLSDRAKTKAKEIENKID